MDLATVLLLILVIFIGYKAVDYVIRIPRVKLAPGEKKHIFVTGCDSGFGNMFVKQMASKYRDRYVIYAGCLTEAGRSDIQKSGFPNLTPVSIDVSKETSVREAFEVVSNSVGTKGLWAVVNNAGVMGTSGSLEWMDNEEYTKVLDVNFFGIVNVSKRFLPLLKRSHGRIVNTISIIGRLALPYSAPYMTSKFAALGFSDGLRREMKAFDVSVHIIEPGFFSTALTDPEILKRSMTRIWAKLDPDMREEYGEAFFQSSMKTMATVLPFIASSKLNLVIDCYEHAVTAAFPRGRYMPGLDARCLYWPLTLMPEWLSDFILTFLSRILSPEPAGCKKYR